jgi:hypothetical protein
MFGGGDDAVFGSFVCGYSDYSSFVCLLPEDGAVLAESDLWCGGLGVFFIYLNLRCCFPARNLLILRRGRHLFVSLGGISAVTFCSC